MNRHALIPTLLTLVALSVCQPTAEAQQLTSEAIRDAAQQVMGGDDFADVRRRALQGMPQGGDAPRRGFLMRTLESMSSSIADFFGSLFGGGPGIAPRPMRPTTPRSTRPPSSQPSSGPSSSGSGFNFSPGHIILYLGIFLAIILCIWIMASVIQSRSRGVGNRSTTFLDGEAETIALSSPPGEIAVSNYESRAIKLAEQGDFSAAIRELLVGSMSWIERSGLIRFRKGLTNRDYMRAIWQEETQREAFRTTAIQFERIFFGRREATRATFDECLQQFQGCFREATTTATS